MNKLSLLILIILFVHSCSINKRQGFWDKDKSNVKKKENIKIALTKQPRKEQEFNPTLEIKISKKKLNKSSHNNQNNIGE